MAATDWTRSKIRYELELAGWPIIRDIDRKYDLRPGAAYNTTHRPDSRCEKIISDILGVPAHVIWPSRYDAQGVRLKPQPMAAYTPRSVRGHGQKGAAA